MCFFPKDFQYFATSPAVGCSWSFRKWPIEVTAHSSHCDENLRDLLPRFGGEEGWVAVQWFEKKTFSEDHPIPGVCHLWSCCCSMKTSWKNIYFHRVSHNSCPISSVELLQPDREIIMGHPVDQWRIMKIFMKGKMKSSCKSHRWGWWRVCCA